MSVDNAENRAYIQKHRIWILGDAVTCKLMTSMPSEPIQAVISVLTSQKQKLAAPPNQPTPEEAAEAKSYLAKHNVATMVEDWMRAVLDNKPAEPIDFSIDYFQRMENDRNDDGKAASEPAVAAAAPAETSE